MTEEQSFADFVRERAPALYRYGYVLTGNSHDADDLVQEALIRLRGAWSRVDRRDDPTGYVRTTMARLHISTWRRRRREFLMSSIPETTAEDAAIADVQAGRGVDSEVWRLLSTLPPRQRAVIVLRYYERMTDEEIAAALGISRVTIRSQASRALEKLRATPGVDMIQGAQR
ncbi:MAG TPA: SigE family RNA polymerase sigma factor [Micromonosporaceae bacterium]